jgi:hypothetical protein
MESAVDNSDELPADVREFLLSDIDSVVELEALVLIRANQATRWSADMLARRLFVEVSSAAAVMEALISRGFLRQAGENAQYAAQGERDAIVQRVVDAYPRFLIPMTHVIHGKARSGAQQFADAFRLRDRKS